MSNRRRTTFYINVTAYLADRVMQHREASSSRFVRTNRCYDLVYYERFNSILDAIYREKQLKRYQRACKLKLIKSLNPQMRDLSGELI